MEKRDAFRISLIAGLVGAMAGAAVSVGLGHLVETGETMQALQVKRLSALYDKVSDQGERLSRLEGAK